MIEIGHFSLILAFFTCFIQIFYALTFKNLQEFNYSSRAAVACFLLTFISFLTLMNGYLTSDFSIINVFLNSHANKPLLYKITGLWSNHEGSMVLWALFLTFFGALFSLTARHQPKEQQAHILAAQGFFSCAFLLFILITSNPFDRINPAPIMGQGMNPLLQDPGIAFHPPLLYLGYVGLSIVFSYGLSALIQGKIEPQWSKSIKPWLISSWMFLTAGIGLGSWWAYYELGWGGWWYWDPVENVSLIPWLISTALIHCLHVVDKRDHLKIWTLLLCLLTFSFSLLGTFLVRSGILTSVHTFAHDPDRGLFILTFLIITIGGSFCVFMMRAHHFKSQEYFKALSRESSLLLNTIFLFICAAIITLGTLYPLILETFTNKKISVGAPWFNQTVIPFALPIIFLMPWGVQLAWFQNKKKKILKNMGIQLLSMAILTIMMIWTFYPHILIPFTLALGVISLISTLKQGLIKGNLHHIKNPSALLKVIRSTPLQQHATTLAHSAVSMFIISIALSSYGSIESIRYLKTHSSMSLSEKYTLTLEKMETYEENNYVTQKGKMTLKTAHGNFIASLFPEKRYYPVEKKTTTEAAIYSTIQGDFYVIIGDKTPQGWIVRAYFKPMILWIWISISCIVISGILSLLALVRKKAYYQKNTPL